MPADYVGSKVIIPVAGINDQINQHIFIEGMFLRIPDIELFADQLPDFIRVQIWKASPLFLRQAPS